MNKQVIKILANTLAIYIATYIFPDVTVSSLVAAIIAGVVLWLVNLIVRPVLVLITLPINFLTLGIFSLVINTWMILLAARLTGGFWVSGFWTAFGVGVLIAIVNVILEKFLREK